jgi:hypothetical protein
MHPLEVVSSRNDFPLTVNLANSAKQELFEAEDMLDHTEDGFDRAFPFTISLPTAARPQTVTRSINKEGIRPERSWFFKALQTARMSLPTIRNIRYNLGLDAYVEVRGAIVAGVGQNLRDDTNLWVKLSESNDCRCEQRGLDPVWWTPR